MTMAALFVLNCLLTTVQTASVDDDAHVWMSASFVPDELHDLGVATLIRDDAEATAVASADFGNVSVSPAAAAVLYPSCPADIAALLRASCARPSPFPVSARGCGHSVRQAGAPGVVVVDMPSLGCLGGGSTSARLSVSAEGQYIARIPLLPAPTRARWVRLLYTDATALTGDQEQLIDVERGGTLSGLMDYVEGTVLADKGLIGSWRSPSSSSSSFFSEPDVAAQVAELAEEAGGVLYCLEGALYYGGAAGGESDTDIR